MRMINKSNVRNIILLLIIITIILGLGFIIKKNINNIMSIKCFIIKSGSMQPTLNIKDIIITKKEKEYYIGDIITYNVNDEYFVTHRIVKRDEENFITKGDNNNCEDKESIKIEDVEGKVIAIIDFKVKCIATFFIGIIICFLWKGN